jgi:hypothetical protein
MLLEADKVHRLQLSEMTITACHRKKKWRSDDCN